MGSKIDSFLCDPKKNTECKKRRCHINGGPCYYTYNKECEKNEDYVAYKCSECGTINFIENGIDGRKCSDCDGDLIVIGKAVIQEGLNNG